MRRLRFSPVLVLASLAVFLAAGGSGYALGHKVAPQPRCAAGAVRGIAVVSGDPLKGLVNMSGVYSSAANLFGYRFNCTGGAVEVRKAPVANAFDVRFRGITPTVAIATGAGGQPSADSVQVQPDGSFRVFVAGQSDQPDGNSFAQTTLPFVIVAL